MKKTFSVSLTIVLTLLFRGPADTQKIKSVGGVTIIANGKTPNPPPGQAAKIALTEELTVGQGENPDESFSAVGAFVVDPEGNIFALDTKDCNIKVYDKEGKFLRRIGKKGQGPGELGTSSGILMTGDGQILVEDVSNRRLALFKRSGEFIKSISTADKLGLVSLILDPQGGFAGREMGLTEGNVKMFFEIKKYNQDLKPLFSLDKIEIPILLPGSGAKINPMEIMSIYQIDKDGRIYYGRNAEYEIKIYDREGNHIRTIQKEYDRTKIAKEDIDEMMERIGSAGPAGANLKDMLTFPEYFPPFQQFFLDDRGRLYVRTYSKGKAKHEYEVDVFDAEGRFIAQFISKSELQLIKGDKAYGMEETEDGFRVIKRYAVSWK